MSVCFVKLESLASGLNAKCLIYIPVHLNARELCLFASQKLNYEGGTIE